MKYWAFSLSILFVVVALVWSASRNGETVLFSVDGESLPLFNVLAQKRQGSSRLTGYKYVNCGTPQKEAANLSKLILSPDPLVFPGMLNVEFAVDIKSKIDSPLQANVTLEKKLSSGGWLKIPCIAQIGSCVYDDICTLLAQISDCPEPFQQAGIPCKCPFQPNAYTFPKSGFQVDVALFPAGDYQAIANLTVGDQSVACVQLFVTFE